MSIQATEPAHQIFLDRILEDVLAQVHFDSYHHGLEHWMRVERNARWLASKTPGADELVCRAFALLHDSQRHDDGYDVHHGPRAAQYVTQLQEEYGDDWILDGDQTYELKRACNGHTAANPDPDKTSLNPLTMDPTVACCWDADRLDLGRVGIVPDAKYLFTEEGRALAVTKEYFDLDDMGIQVTSQNALAPTMNPDDAW